MARSEEVGPMPAGAVPTVNDVARRAGVSRQTVSNVINAPERVRETTARRVQQAIDELGYRPHRNARNLKTRSSHLLGYRVRPSSGGGINVVLDRFLHALTETAGQSGYQILLFTCAAGEEELSTFDDLLATQTVDGFVISETDYADARIAHLQAKGIPFASFGRTDVGGRYPWVDVDNEAGTRLAVEHLVATGRRRIAYVGWPSGAFTPDERARGYLQGLAAAGLRADPSLDVRGVEGPTTGHEAATSWLASADPPDAIVAASDLLATGVLEAARDAGVRVGPDLAVVGFDDSPTAPYLSPPLSSLRQPIEEVAAHVVGQLIARIGGEEPPEDGVLVPPTLIVRDSSLERNP